MHLSINKEVPPSPIIPTFAVRERSLRRCTVWRLVNPRTSSTYSITLTLGWMILAWTLRNTWRYVPSIASLLGYRSHHSTKNGAKASHFLVVKLAEKCGCFSIILKYWDGRKIVFTEPKAERYKPQIYEGEMPSYTRKTRSSQLYNSTGVPNDG